MSSSPDGTDRTGRPGPVPRPSRPVLPRPSSSPDATPDAPGTVLGAAAAGVLLLLRDALLNGAVLLSLVVGIGGVLTRDLPWLWLGPLVGVAGVVASVAAARERRTWTPGRVWAVVVAVLVAEVAVMWLMWG